MEELDLENNSSSSSFRARSNTWPLPRPELQIGDDVYGVSPSSEENEVNDILISDVSDHHISPDHVHQQHTTTHLLVRDSSSPGETVIPTTAHEVLSLSKNQRSSLQPSSPGAVSTGATTQPSSASSQSKKNTARRNAWGNMSYADLITQAIQGSPDKRLTLSQIYEWMVQNVPYFKDKGDSNSSAGWKVSLLSLLLLPLLLLLETHHCAVQCVYVCECYNTFYQLHENVLLSTLESWSRQNLSFSFPAICVFPSSVSVCVFDPTHTIHTHDKCVFRPAVTERGMCDCETQNFLPGKEEKNHRRNHLLFPRTSHRISTSQSPFFSTRSCERILPILFLFRNE